MEDLSPEELEKFLQFQDLTGIEDMQECKGILQRHSWDIEVAVQDTLNAREGRPSVFNQDSHRLSDAGSNNHHHEVVPRSSFIPARAPNQSLLSYVIYIVYNVVSQTVWSFFSFFARFLRPDFRLSRASEPSEITSATTSPDLESDEGISLEDEEGGSEQNEPSSSSDSKPSESPEQAEDQGMILTDFTDEPEDPDYKSPYLTMAYRPECVAGALTGSLPADPVEDVERFIETFNERYTADVEMRPAFWRSSYSQALAAAKQELKFLLVYLHCKDHQDTDQFCRETLCSLLLTEYLRQANWLLWGCDVSSCEGYRVSQALRENGYPFLAVAVLRGTRMTVVFRFEGPIAAEDLVTTLRNVVSENEVSLIAARADRNERSFTQSLRRQQDEAYEESLLADQLKEMKRREQEERERAEQERIQQEIDEKIRKKEEIARLKIDLADRVPAEPEPDDSNAVHLVIKLPTGRRLERRFLKIHTLQDVYHYVFCHPESPDNFDIATNFPKRVLACQPQPDTPNVQTLEQAGLKGKQALFVYDLEA